MTSIIELFSALLSRNSSILASGDRYLNQAVDRQDLALRKNVLNAAEPVFASQPSMAAGVR